MKKKVIIKCTSSCGKSMISNAESHTLRYFCEVLVKKYDVVISGLEIESDLKNYLIDIGVNVKRPLIKYLKLKKFKSLFHIPVSIINLFNDAIIEKPDFLFCLGGVFYNGLSILFVGKILKIQFLVRSAEDHFKIYKLEERSIFLKMHAYFRFIVSKFVIQNSDYFLTVGKSSLEMFRRKYSLSRSKSFQICGPIDYGLKTFDEFKFSKNYAKLNLKKKYNLNSKKTLLFISNGSKAKGTNYMFDLLKRIKQNNLDIVILWVTSLNNVPKEYIYLLSNLKLIKPMSKFELIGLLKGSDFLFFASEIGVGYGQIILEALLCKTEIICFRPIGDLLRFTRDNKYKEFEEVLNRLSNNIKKKNLKIPEFMKYEKIELELNKLFDKLI
tara:strand:- start:2509 stop:3660 length:1152 start_codon:yes stop_codon:yes gene_type:complete